MEQYLEFAGNHPYLVMAFMAILSLLISGEIARLTRGFPDISPAQAVQVMNQDRALLLDVRSIAEWREGHILNATHIPLGELPGRLKELEKHRGAPVVVVCRSGSRSASACSLLKKQGFEQLHNLGGGLLAWSSANLPLVKK